MAKLNKQKTQQLLNLLPSDSAAPLFILQRYHNGDMDEEEKFLMEEYLLSSDISRDALDGMELISTREFADDVNLLNSLIQRKTGVAEEKQINIKGWGRTILIAATFLVLIVAGILIAKNNGWFESVFTKKEMAQVVIKEEPKVKTPEVLEVLETIDTVENTLENSNDEVLLPPTVAPSNGKTATIVKDNINKEKGDQNTREQSDKDRLSENRDKASSDNALTKDAEEITVVEAEDKGYDKKVISTNLNSNNQPSFPGGEAALENYMLSNMSYDGIDDNGNKITGRVVLKFTVDKKGKPTNISVVKGLNKKADKEAINILKNMPRWTPATNEKGEAIPFDLTLPVEIK